jgi:CubicO group peptidase (beta-lactamase class C family)
VDKNLPMTHLTVQPIASVTKSFTVAAMATLVREGKLSWDKPVRDYLPDFKMFNDTTTLNATPRDLVTHRTGLPRHDYSWFNATATREELYKRLPYLEPSAQLRATWQYNNFMYMTAGYLSGKVAGGVGHDAWENLVRANLLKPLNMGASSLSINEMMKSPHVGAGYAWDENEAPKRVDYKPVDAMAPTGAINSNMEDMAHYLQMLLGNGQFAGKTILNAADIIEMTNPQMVMADARLFDEISATQYGMGFFLTHYRGEKLVHHGGNMPGASSLLSFLPNKKIAVFVTANLSASSLPTVLSYAMYDRLLGLKPVDWSGRFWDRKEKTKASEVAAKKQNLSPRQFGTSPSHRLTDYAGDYGHPGYGVIKFVVQGQSLAGSYNGLSSNFPHFHYDVFEAPDDKLNELAKLKAQFVTDIDGEISAVRIGLESVIKPIEFLRQPDAAFKDAIFLAPFVGNYELGATPVIVALRDDNVLTLAIPGQPVRELIGLRGRKFAMKGSSGYSVEFVVDEKGKVNQAAC